jgi:putative NADH-flavin reductase
LDKIDVHNIRTSLCGLRRTCHIPTHGGVLVALTDTSDGRQRTMRLAIFGATGGTGTYLVEQALAAGHEVTAVVRDPKRLTISGRPGLHVEMADVMDPVAIVPFVEDTDAVISALGPRGRGPTTVSSDGARSIVTAMEKADARRLIVITGSIVDDTGNGFLMTHTVKPFARRTFLKDVCADMRRTEAAVHASDLDWTILRPPRLTDKPATGKYRAAMDRNVPRGVKIPRADVAAYILDHLDDASTMHKHIFVAT